MFINQLKNAGHELVNENSIDSNTICVLNSNNKKILRLCEEKKIPTGNRIIILWEPPSINSKIYSEIARNKYGKIFTPSKRWVQTDNSEYFLWPQIRGMYKETYEFENRKNKYIFVGANKFSYDRRELYSFRRSLIKKDNNKIIDVFGIGWSKNLKYRLKNIIKALINNPFNFYKIIKTLNYLMFNFKNSHGHCDNKFITAGQYKFALVIENSNDYVSEKLFDAIASGCLTFYMGPNLNQMGYDPNLAIEIKGSVKNIIDQLESVIESKSKIEIKLILENQKNAFEKINNENNNIQVFKNLALSINIYLKEKNE